MEARCAEYERKDRCGVRAVRTSKLKDEKKEMK